MIKTKQQIRSWIDSRLYHAQQSADKKDFDDLIEKLDPKKLNHITSPHATKRQYMNLFVRSARMKKGMRLEFDAKGNLTDYEE